MLPMTSPASRCTDFRALPWPAKFSVLGLAGAVAAFSALVWPQWLHDDDLTHGIFLPFLAVILVAESRRDASPRFARPGAGPLAACALLLLAGLASLAVAVAYAAAMGWSHAMADFMAAAALVLALGAGWVALADPRVRFLPLNWAAGVAVALWLFASPPPPGTYARLASFLQAEVTHGVVWILSAAGIAAFQQGNVIELARTSVGVSEACSGVRSLISCTVAGLFLSAILVRKPAHRALVIAVSPAIGLAMNFLRSLLLTLLANAGVSIEGRWHDLTGASILVATTLLVAAFAFRLHRLEPGSPPARGDNPPGATGRSPLPVMVAAALILTAVMGAAIAAAGGAERAETASEPNLAALFPEAPHGWTVQTTPDFDQYSGILHTHALIERVYSAGASADGAHVTLYLAYWRPGQAAVSLVDAHSPDACWPGTGWVAEPVTSGRESLSVGGRLLAPAESRLFAHGAFETRVWFWHLYGGRPITFVDPYSVVRLLGLAWHYGLGHAKDQMFVRVSSDRPWQEIASQPVLRQFFENMRPLGL
jgi:exosortase